MSQRRSSDEEFRARLEKAFSSNVLDDVDISFLLIIMKSEKYDAWVRLKAIDTLRCLCQVDEYKKALASKELGLLSTLFELVGSKSFPVSRILECLQSLAKTSASNTIRMGSPDSNFLDSLIDEIRLKKSASDEVRIACSVLCTLIVHDYRNIEDIVNQYLHVDCLNFIEAAGPNPEKWRGCNSAEGWSMYVLMLCAAHPEISAEAMLEAGAVQVVAPVARHEGLLGMMASITLAFLTSLTNYGSVNQAFHSIGDAMPELTRATSEINHSSVVHHVLDIFDNTLHKRGGKGYSDSTFVLSMVIRAVRCLILGSKVTDTASIVRTVTLLREVLEIFATREKLGNEPNISGIIECVEVSVEVLHYMLDLPEPETVRDDQQPSANQSPSALDRPIYHEETVSEIKKLLPQVQEATSNLRYCPRADLISNKKTLRMMRDIVAGELIPINFPANTTAPASTSSSVSSLTEVTSKDKDEASRSGRNLLRKEVSFKDLKISLPSTTIGRPPLRRIGSSSGNTTTTAPSRSAYSSPFCSARRREAGGFRIAISRYPIEKESPTYAAEKLFVDGLKQLGYEIVSGAATQPIDPSQPKKVNPRCETYIAMDRCDAALLFISPKYCKSASCRMEELYAWAKQKQGLVKVIYVAMGDMSIKINSREADVDKFRRTVNSRQESYPLYLLSHVQRAYENVVLDMGETEALHEAKANLEAGKAFNYVTMEGLRAKPSANENVHTADDDNDDIDGLDIEFEWGPSANAEESVTWDTVFANVPSDFDDAYDDSQSMSYSLSQASAPSSTCSGIATVLNQRRKVSESTRTSMDDNNLSWSSGGTESPHVHTHAPPPRHRRSLSADSLKEIVKKSGIKTAPKPAPVERETMRQSSSTSASRTWGEFFAKPF